MEAQNQSYNTIDEYIGQFSGDVRERLIRLREVISKAAPSASERISYQMPAYYLEGNLVYFAAFKKHIGFFPTPSGIEPFKEELKEYKCSKGTIQFPNNRPLPYELVRRIVEYRVIENISMAKDRKIK